MEDQVETRGSVEHLQVQHPLSIEPIVQEILKNLSIGELKTCANVNGFWKSQVDLLATHQINVEFLYPFGGWGEKYSIQEIMRARGESKKSLLDFPDLISSITKPVSASKRTRRPHLTLRLNDILGIDGKNLIEFLEKFGHLVFRLNYAIEEWVSIRKFSQFLWKYLPNLEELHMDEFHIYSSYVEPVIPEEEKKCLERLKIIGFFQEKKFLARKLILPDEPFRAILIMAPNLQVIESFPLENASVLEETGHSKLVRHVLIPECDERMSFDKNLWLSWLENFSRLEPKLSRFELPRCPQFRSAKMFRSEKKYVTTILESSRESLEHLVIFPSQRHHYFKYPSGLTRVRVLEFANERNQDEVMSFHWNFKTRKPFFIEFDNVIKIFPNLKEVRVSHVNIAPYNIMEYFPGTTCFQHLHVTRLHVNSQTAQCLENLSQVFPSVEHLTIDMTHLNMEALKNIINDISAGFPHLKGLVLEIGVDRFRNNLGIWANCEQSAPFFDSVITGIPDHYFFQSKREANLNLDLHRTEPCLLEIGGLQNLEFIFTNKFNGNYSRPFYFPASLFSQACSEYGFKIHPHIQVAVRVEDEHSWISTAMMIKSVGAVLDDIELDMSYKRCIS